MSIDWKYSSAAIPPGVMTDMPFQLDAPGIYKVIFIDKFLLFVRAITSLSCFNERSLKTLSVDCGRDASQQWCCARVHVPQQSASLDNEAWRCAHVRTQGPPTLPCQVYNSALHECRGCSR